MVQAGRILIAGLAVYNAFPTSARVQTPVTGAGQGDGATMRREEGDATIVRSMSTVSACRPDQTAALSSVKFVGIITEDGLLIFAFFFHLLELTCSTFFV